MIIHKCIVIILIISSNCLLFGNNIPDSTPDVSKDTSGAPKKHLPPITIIPLHDYDAPNIAELEKKHPKTCEQAPSTQQDKLQIKNTPLIEPAEWILKSSMDTAPEVLKGIFYIYNHVDMTLADHNNI